MTRLAFIVPGHVVASERVTKVPFRKASGKLGIRAFTPGASAEYLERVALFASQAVRGEPAWRAVVARKLPLRVQIHVIRNKWLGDWDNCAKGICDGMQRGGVFANDNRIVQATVSIHTDPKAEERAELLVEVCSGVLQEPLWMAIARSKGWLPQAKGASP